MHRVSYVAAREDRAFARTLRRRLGEAAEACARVGTQWLTFYVPPLEPSDSIGTNIRQRLRSGGRVIALLRHGAEATLPSEIDGTPEIIDFRHWMAGVEEEPFQHLLQVLQTPPPAVTIDAKSHLHAFFSVGHNDCPQVEPLATALKQRGFGIWLYTQESNAAERLDEMIVAAIVRAQAFLVFFSSDHLRTKVVNEVNTACLKAKKVHPIRLGGDTPHILNALVLVDLEGLDHERRVATLEHIIRGVK